MNRTIPGLNQRDTVDYLTGKGWKQVDSWLDYGKLIVLMERDGDQRLIYETGYMKKPAAGKLSSNQKTQMT